MSIQIELARKAVAEGNYTEGFYDWITENFQIYEYFQGEAIKFAKLGQKKIGARMLVENIRYKTKLREMPLGRWKINNSYTPDLSRLFAILNPEYDDLFEYRGPK